MLAFAAWFGTYFVQLLVLRHLPEGTRTLAGAGTLLAMLVPAVAATSLALRPVRRWAARLRPATDASLLGRTGVVVTPTLAALFLAAEGAGPETGERRARVAGARAMQALFGSRSAADALRAEMAGAVARFARGAELPFGEAEAARAAAYLYDELAGEEGLAVSLPARELADALLGRLDAAGLRAGFDRALERLRDRPAARCAHAVHWLEAACTDAVLAPLVRHVPEAAALLLHGRRPGPSPRGRPAARLGGGAAG